MNKFKPLKLYIAGKVSKNSLFGKYHWRDEFIAELSSVNSMQFVNLDPLKFEIPGQYDPQAIFDKDCWLINQADCVIVYLSDDISVGGSQEMLIAKYLKKPLVGFAPLGGKFNSPERESFGHLVRDYVDPFVFATCDVVCGTAEDVAAALLQIPDHPKTIMLINDSIARAEGKYEL